MTNRANAEKKGDGSLYFYACRIMRGSFPFWTICMLFAPSAFSKTVCVATRGADSGPGTLTQPYATIAKAAAVMVGGDTALIRAGTYNLAAQISPASGSAGKPITYKAYPGESVIINGGSGYCFGLQAKSYLYFDSLKMTSSDTAVGAGMIYMEGTVNCTFINCEFYGMPAARGSENTSVIRCMGTDPGSNGGYSTNCIFRNNYFHDNLSPAMRLYDAKGWIIENNEFRNCSQAVGGKDMPTDMMVRRNLIVNTFDAAFYFAGQGGMSNDTITENIVVGAKIGFEIGGLGTSGAMRQNVFLFNNTFYECEAFILGWDDGYNTNCNFWNNIVYAITSLNIGQGADVAGRIVNVNRWGASGLTTANYSFDYNCLQIPGDDKSIWFVDGSSQYYYTISTWNTAKGFEAHSFSSNPLFVNAATAEFHLQTGSTCKAKGKTGEDLGAYPRGNDGTVIGIIGKSTTSSIGQTQPDLIIRVKPSKTAGANCTFDILGRRITAGPLIPPAGIMIRKDGKRSLGIH